MNCTVAVGVDRTDHLSQVRLVAVSIVVVSDDRPVDAVVDAADTGVVHLDPAIRRPHVRLLLEGRRLLRQGGRGSRCRGHPGRLACSHHPLPQVRP